MKILESFIGKQSEKSAYYFFELLNSDISDQFILE